LAQTAERIAPGQAQIINPKQISNHNACLPDGLFGGNDQNQTSANSVEPFARPVKYIFVFYWYLFAIWNLLFGAYQTS
jgi:hypothetical protein